LEEFMKAVLNAAAIAAAIVVANPVHAEQTLPSSRMVPGMMLRDDTVNRHFGFLIRPDIGAGYLSTSMGDTTQSGGAGMFGIIVGGAVAENLILGGHLYDGVIGNPNAVSPSGPTSNTQATMVGVGPNLTYYFMPVNMYASATVAFTRMNLTIGNFTGDSAWGLGTRLSLGKEWWVSDHWGLGLAGHFSYSGNKSDTTDTAQMISTWGAGLSFSATYN
jgi:hypothetical protein